MKKSTKSLKIKKTINVLLSFAVAVTAFLSTAGNAHASDFPVDSNGNGELEAIEVIGQGIGYCIADPYSVIGTVIESPACTASLASAAAACCVAGVLSPEEQTNAENMCNFALTMAALICVLEDVQDAEDAMLDATVEGLSGGSNQ